MQERIAASLDREIVTKRDQHRPDGSRCQDAGADAVSLVNTFTAMAIDAETRKPRISTITGGLSGSSYQAIALRMVYEASHAVDIP